VWSEGGSGNKVTGKGRGGKMFPMLGGRTLQAGVSEY